MISDFQRRIKIKCICNRGKGLAVRRLVCICIGGMGLLPYNLDQIGLDEEDYNNQNALNGSQVCGVLCVCMCVGIERYVRQRQVTDTDTHGRREGPSYHGTERIRMPNAIGYVTIK